MERAGKAICRCGRRRVRGVWPAEGGLGLGDEKTKEMFDGVDTDNDGLVEFVQCYKAINDEARARKFADGGGNFFSRLFGN